MKTKIEVEESDWKTKKAKCLIMKRWTTLRGALV